MKYFFIIGISIALFLVVILLTKEKKSTADICLSWLLFFSAQTIFNTFLVETRLYFSYPDLLVLGFTSPILVSVCLFLYTKYQTNGISFQRKDLLHFLPAILIILLYFPFFFFSFSKKQALMAAEGAGYEFINVLRILAINLSGIIYSLWSLWILYKYRKNIKNEFSNTERIEFNWLMFLILGMFVIWVVVLLIHDDKIISLSATIFVILLGYFGITQAGVFDSKKLTSPDIALNETEIENIDFHLSAQSAKYQSSKLSDEDSIQIHAQLLKILENEKPYLNPELTLAELAKLIPVHPNKLSEVINKYELKNFYDLINGYRIQEFLRKLNQPESKQYTFISLAYDCGFNSKASFNRNFKKYTGKTPSEYLKMPPNLI